MAALVSHERIIESDPAFRGGQPRIAGTRVSVSRVAALLRRGVTPAEMAERVFEGAISLAQIHAAIAFYLLTQAAIDAADTTAEEAYDRASEAAATLRRR